MNTELLLTIIVAATAIGFAIQSRIKISRFEKTLKEEEQKELSILDELNDGIAVVNTSGRLTLWNSSFKKTFDITDEDISRKDLKNLIKETEIVDIYNLALSSENSVVKEVKVAAGNYIALTASPTGLAKKGEGKEVMLIVHDISRQKGVERMRVDFVANVSHELKTPMAVIQGFVETLLDGAIDKPETAKNFLSTIQKHTERLNLLIDDLLTLSEIELGDKKLDFEHIEIFGFLNNVEQTFADAAQKEGVSLKVEPPVDIETVNADKNRLMQIMINLVGNAIKHTPKGGEIKVRCHRLLVTADDWDHFPYKSFDPGRPLLSDKLNKQSFVEFEVEDTGEGIPDNAIPRLMERFYRIDKARSREVGSTGLGLSIVKHILIAHGGAVKIKSRMGKGTSFSFILPESMKN